MYSKKNLLAAVVLGLSMSLTSVAPAVASADDVSVQVNVQQNVKGSVNWEKVLRLMLKRGVQDCLRENVPAARGTALARRAAVVDAYRQLAETIKGVQIDAETSMRDLAIESDIVNTKIKALVKGARIVEETAMMTAATLSEWLFLCMA